MTSEIKRIGIDCRSMSIGGGVKTYLINLLNEIGKIDNKNQYYIYYDSQNNIGTFNFDNFKEIVLPNKRKFLIPYWEQIRLRNRVVKDQIDVFHAPKNTLSIFLPKKIKKIITILDLTPFILSREMSYLDLIYWRIFMPLSIRLCDSIISISKSTEDDLIRFFPKSKNKINIVYLGSDNRKTLQSIDKEQSFLVVGAIRPRKNIERILIALSQLSQKDVRIYIVGKNLNYLNKIIKLVGQLKIEDRVVFKGYVSKEELDILYSKSLAYLYPSLYEGFGLPILEAQAHGLPVITSNISSMPEVAGNSALLVDPYSVEEIKDAMERIISEEKTRIELIKLGYDNLERFSWKKCAYETLRIYEQK